MSGERRAIWLGALAARGSRYSELRLLARALATATGSSWANWPRAATPPGASRREYAASRSGRWRGAQVAADRMRTADARAAAGRLSAAATPSHGRMPDARAAVDPVEARAAWWRSRPIASEEMKRVAHMLLPAGTFAETSGTYVNLEGRWQSHGGAAKPLGASRPAWKILRVLGNQLDLAAFEYQSSDQVRDELKSRLESRAAADVPRAANLAAGSQRAGARRADVSDRSGRASFAAPLLRTRDGRAAPVSYGGAA
jgi:NADH-quinone oxidoreductase subunit G